MTWIDDSWDNWTLIFGIVDLEIVIVALIYHIRVYHSCRLGFLLHSLIGRYRHCKITLFLSQITLLEGIELLLLLVLQAHHHRHFIKCRTLCSVHPLNINPW